MVDVILCHDVNNTTGDPYQTLGTNIFGYVGSCGPGPIFNFVTNMGLGNIPVQFSCKWIIKHHETSNASTVKVAAHEI